MNNAIVIDIDGTLCEIKGPNETYSDVKPKGPVVETLKDYKRKGYRVVLYTSRNMRSFNNNTGEISAKTLPVLFDWLEKHDIPFDEIHVGKPWAGPKGFYVDDRTVRPDEFTSLTEEQINQLLAD
jgi:capsule biosynthesis phosphatase